MALWLGSQSAENLAASFTIEVLNLIAADPPPENPPERDNRSCFDDYQPVFASAARV